MSKAYKVFKRIDDKLTSAGSIPDSCIFTFSQSKINRPTIKGSEFFCFKSQTRAKNFAEYHMGLNKKYEIWEIETGRLKRREYLPSIWTGIFSSSTLSELLEGFWADPDEYVQDRFRSTNLGGACEGAYSTPWVRLVKKVKPHKNSKN